MTAFLSQHWLDITTTLLGLAYILLEYKASIRLWIVGFVMQVMDIVLYYQHGLYADCAMEFYYIAMTVYGFATWKFGKKHLQKQGEELPITHPALGRLHPRRMGSPVVLAHTSRIHRPRSRCLHHRPEPRRHLGSSPQIPRAMAHLDRRRCGNQRPLLLQRYPLQSLALRPLRRHRRGRISQVAHQDATSSLIEGSDW